MFKKQHAQLFERRYTPSLKPFNKQIESHIEHKVISKRDEERIKNIISEQPKVRRMLVENLQYRNDFLRSQRIMNFQFEKNRLIALEAKVTPNLRYYAPPLKLDDYPDAPNRLEQLERKMKEDLIGKSGPDFHNTRFF